MSPGFSEAPFFKVIGNEEESYFGDLSYTYNGPFHLLALIILGILFSIKNCCGGK